jgi:hypothetical protein
MIGLVVNDRQWMTRLLYMMIKQVSCPRKTRSSNDCQIMKITRWKNPLKIPHHDWREPFSSFMILRRITNACYNSSSNESLDILLMNLRKEGFGPMNGSFDVNFNESKEGKLDGHFLFREFEKVVKKTPYTYLWIFIEPEQVFSFRCFYF